MKRINPKNTVLNNTIIWAHAVVFLVCATLIAYYSSREQVMPNFHYAAMPSGQWQITDNSHPTLDKGSVIEALVIHGTTHPLDKHWLFPNFYGFRNYAMEQQSFANERLLYGASRLPHDQALTTHAGEYTAQTNVQLLDSNGQAHRIALRPHRLSDIEAITVLLYALGVIKFAFGFWVANKGALTRQKLIFLTSSVILGVLCFLSMPALNRVWVVNPQTLYLMLMLTQLLAKLYLFTLLVIWFDTPVSLSSHSPAIKILFVAVFALLGIAYWLYFFSDTPNYRWQTVMPFIVVSVLGYAGFYWQWRYHQRQAQSPLSVKIALRWMAILIICCGVVNFVTNMLTLQNIVDGRYLSVTFFINAILLSFGIGGLLLHEQLYKLDKQWWLIWGTLCALSLFGLSLNVLAETPLGVSNISWIVSGSVAIACYLFVVYRFRSRYTRAEIRLLEIAVPRLQKINAHNTTPETVNAIWQGILSDIFQPSSIALQPAKNANSDTQPRRRDTDPTAKATLANAGETLIVPAADNQTFALTHASNGLRLFSRDNCSKADMLWQMVWQTYHANRAYQAGEFAERRRIAHQLNDDLGSKLQHLSAQEGSYGAFAQKTLQELNALTSALSHEQQTLAAIITDMQYQIRNHCDNANIRLYFDSEIDNSIANEKLSPQVAAIIAGTFQALSRNAIQQNGTTTIWLVIVAEAHRCVLRIENDGAPPATAHAETDKIVEQRIKPLNGSITREARRDTGSAVQVRWETAQMYSGTN